MVWRIYIVLLLGLGAMLPNLASAAPENALSLGAGATLFGTGSGLQTAPTLTAQYGLRLGGGHLGIDTQIASAFARLQNQDHSATQLSGSLIGSYYPFANGSSPYISLGLGASSNEFASSNRDTSLMGVFGLGYEQRLSDHWGLRVGLQDQLLFHTPRAVNGPLNDLQVTGGISYFWGGDKERSAFPIISSEKR